MALIPVTPKIPVRKKKAAFFESEVPPDLILMTIWLTTAIVSINLSLLEETPVRYVLTIPILLFIPGYSLIAAVFPRKGDIDLTERISLSIGLSIAIVTLIGLGLNYTSWGIRLESVVISLTIFTLGMIILAHYRRGLFQPDERFGYRFPPIGEIISGITAGSGNNGIDRSLSILLVFSVTIALVITAFVIVAPQNGERFSEFFILSKNLTTADYPEQIIPGNDYPLYIGVGNQEDRNQNYTIETWLLLTKFDKTTNSSSIISMNLGSRQSVSLANNETKLIPYTLNVKKTGYDRVEFLLFNETLPGNEVTGSNRINASYRDLHIWITDI